MSQRPKRLDERGVLPNANKQQQGGQGTSVVPEGVRAPPGNDNSALFSQATGDHHRNMTAVDREAFLRRLQQLELIERHQRFRALNQQMLLSQSSLQMDPRLFTMGSLPGGGGPPDASTLAAMVARRREEEAALMFNRQLMALDASRRENPLMRAQQGLMRPQQLANNTVTATSAMLDQRKQRTAGMRQATSPGNMGFFPSSSIGWSSLLEVSRRESMPNNDKTATLAKGTNRSPIDASENPGASKVSLNDHRTRSPIDNLLLAAKKQSTSPSSVVESLIERFTAGGTKEASFPLKLHAILANPENHDCICWLPHGRSWRIIRVTKFEKEIIPRYFRHAKYASFMRQGKSKVVFILSVSFGWTDDKLTFAYSIFEIAVNGWEFCRNALEDNSYTHPLFLRDDPERCLDMIRFGATKNAAGFSIKGNRAKEISSSSPKPKATPSKRKSSSTSPAPSPPAIKKKLDSEKAESNRQSA